MKRLLIMLVAVCSTALVQAQKKNTLIVPATVKTSLSKKFPNATQVKWEKEGDNFEANFKSNKISYSTILDKSGNILETEVPIQIRDLPSAARAYVASNYAHVKIKDAAQITNAQGVVTYEAGIEGKDLIFDTQGRLLESKKD